MDYPSGRNSCTWHHVKPYYWPEITDLSTSPFVREDTWSCAPAFFAQPFLDLAFSVVPPAALILPRNIPYQQVTRLRRPLELLEHHGGSGREWGALPYRSAHWWAKGRWSQREYAVEIKLTSGVSTTTYSWGWMQSIVCPQLHLLSARSAQETNSYHSLMVDPQAKYSDVSS